MKNDYSEESLSEYSVNSYKQPVTETYKKKKLISITRDRSAYHVVRSNSNTQNYSQDDSSITINNLFPVGKELTFGIGYIDPDSLQNYFDNFKMPINDLKSQNETLKEIPMEEKILKEEKEEKGENLCEINNHQSYQCNKKSQKGNPTYRSRSQTSKRPNLNKKNEKYAQSIKNENTLKISDSSVSLTSSSLLSKIVKLNQNDKILFNDIKLERTDNNKSKSRSHSKEPFEKLKVKLDGNFVDFLKRHRFSTLMMGNKLYEGKSGDYYLKNNNKNKNRIGLKTDLMNLELSSNSEINKKHNKVIIDADINNVDKDNLELEGLKKYQNYLNYENNFETHINIQSLGLDLSSEFNEYSENKLKNESSQKSYTSSDIKFVDQSNLSKIDLNLNNLVNLKKNLCNNNLNNNLLQKQMTYNKNIITNQEPRSKTNKSILNENQNSKRNKNTKKFSENQNDLKNLKRNTKSDNNNHDKHVNQFNPMKINNNFKKLPTDIGFQKSSQDLTPIPIRITKPDKVLAIEYNQAERAAVTIRRIEYSENVKIKKEEISSEAQNIYINLLFEAKTIILQRWWRKNLPKLKFLNLYATKLQKIFRGYLSRVAFKAVNRQIYFIFPFLNAINFVYQKRKIKISFNKLFSNFAALAKNNYILKKINLIKRTFRRFINFKNYKRSLLENSISIFCLNSLSISFHRIKKYSDFNYNIKIEKIFTLILNSCKKICYNLHFNSFKKRMYNYRLIKMKIRMISRNLKELLPVIKRSYKRLFYRLWKKKYLKLKNKYNILVKCLGAVLRKITFVPLKNKILLCENNFKYQKRVKILWEIRKKISIYALNKRFKIWRQIICKNKNRENIIKYSLKKKDLITKKFYLDKLKRLCYYIYTSYPYSLNFYVAVNKIKNVAIRNIVRLYHKSEKSLSNSPISSMFNLKNLFIKKRLTTKLSKLLKITAVYYEDKKKIHFNKWINKVTYINERNHSKKFKLKKIIKSTLKRCTIKLKINFKKWVVKTFRRVIIQQNKEIKVIKNYLGGFSILEKIKCTKYVHNSFSKIKNFSLSNENNINLLKIKNTDKIVIEISKNLEIIQHFLRNFILKKQNIYSKYICKIFKLWHIKSQRILLVNSSKILSKFCKNILVKIRISRKVNYISHNLNISNCFNKLNNFNKKYSHDRKKLLLNNLILKKTRLIKEFMKQNFIIFRKTTDMYFKRTYVRGFRMIFKNKIQNTKNKKQLLSHILDKQTENFQGVLQQKYFIRWKKMIITDDYLSEELIFKGTLLGKLEKILKRNFLKLLIYYYNMISDVKFIQKFWRTRSKIISYKKKKKFLNQFINKINELSNK